MPEKSINHDKFCPACGNGLIISAVICPKCGSPVAGVTTKGPKEKSTAIILAVFLSSWGYLYTYKYDAKKFWISTVGAFVPLFLSIVSIIIYDLSYDYNVYTLAYGLFWLFLVLWLIASLVINIIAIVVASTRQESMYKSY